MARYRRPSVAVAIETLDPGHGVRAALVAGLLWSQCSN